MSKLKNLLRSKFLAAICVMLVYIAKMYEPEIPAEAAYGFLAYIFGESAADALGAIRGKKG